MFQRICIGMPIVVTQRIIIRSILPFHFKMSPAVGIEHDPGLQSFGNKIEILFQFQLCQNLRRRILSVAFYQICIRITIATVFHISEQNMFGQQIRFVRFIDCREHDRISSQHLPVIIGSIAQRPVVIIEITVHSYRQFSRRIQIQIDIRT